MALKEVPNTLNRFETIIAYSWAYAKLIFQQVFSLLDSNISRITNRQPQNYTLPCGKQESCGSGDCRTQHWSSWQQELYNVQVYGPHRKLVGSARLRSLLEWIVVVIHYPVNFILEDQPWVIPPTRNWPKGSSNRKMADC